MHALMFYENNEGTKMKGNMQGVRNNSTCEIEQTFSKGSPFDIWQLVE
jgi:hypothetical protein